MPAIKPTGQRVTSVLIFKLDRTCLKTVGGLLQRAHLFQGLKVTHGQQFLRLLENRCRYLGGQSRVLGNNGSDFHHVDIGVGSKLDDALRDGRGRSMGSGWESSFRNGILQSIAKSSLRAVFGSGFLPTRQPPGSQRRRHYAVSSLSDA
jgi:hypothetical protein